MTKNHRRRFILFIMLLAPSLFAIGCDSAASVDRSQMIIHKPARIEGSPDVAEYSVWRPFFNTDAGVISAGGAVGTAFLAQPYADGQSYLVTASHLLGTDTGLTRDIRPREWGTAIQTTFVGDAFGATDSIKEVGHPLVPVDAVQDETKWRDLDIIAFETGPRLKGNAFTFSNETVHVGQRLWMVTALFGGASASQKCHAVKVTEINESGMLTYEFENSKISFQATDGAPLLFDSGTLAGIHLRGEKTETTLSGTGLDNTALRSALMELAATQ